MLINVDHWFRLSVMGGVTAPVMLLQAANDYSLASTQAMADDLSRLSKPHLRKVYPPTGETANDGHNSLYTDIARWEPDVFKFLDENVRHRRFRVPHKKSADPSASAGLCYSPILPPWIVGQPEAEITSC